MTAKEKAIELVERFETYADYHECDAFSERQRMRFNAVSIALISVKNEYYSLREMLFNLKSCGVITDDKFYLYKIQNLIDDEREVIKEIKQL
jgi:hypothetical protein